MCTTRTGPVPTWTLHVNVAQDLVSGSERLGTADPAALLLLHVGAVGTFSARNRSGSPPCCATTWCCELGCRRDRRHGSGAVRPTFLRGAASFTSSAPPRSLSFCLSLSPSSPLPLFQTTQLSARLPRPPTVGSKLGRAAWRCVTSPPAPANGASAELSPRQRPLLLPPLAPLRSAASFTVWMDDVMLFQSAASGSSDDVEAPRSICGLADLNRWRPLIRRAINRSMF